VVRELRWTLLGEETDPRSIGEAEAEVARAARGRATHPEAHRLYLLARHLLDRRTREDTAAAIEYLQRALERDPGFALARAELGSAHARAAERGWVPAPEGYGRAREAVQRALALEPDLAEAHAHMGYIQRLFDWDWHGAEASYARALALAPGNALALRGAGGLASSQGRLEESIELYRRALDQDPLSAVGFHNLGRALHAADRIADAETAFRRALELAP